MNILIISEYFPPDQVGASTRISIIIKELIKFHNVTLITSAPHYPKPKKINQTFLTPIKIYQQKNLKIIKIWMPEINMDSTRGRMIDYFYFTFFSMFGLAYVSEKPDFIWGTSPNIFCGFSAKIAHFFLGGIPIVNIDDIWPEGPIDFGFLTSKFLRLLAEALANASLNRIKIITTISESISKYYRKKYQIPEIYMIPVGIEKKRLNNLVQFKKKKKKMEIETKKKKIVFMYSGKLGMGYDFELLINAFKKIQNEDNSEITLIIRGTGPLETHILNLVKKYKVNNVKLETEYLTVENLNKKLLSADAFVLPMQDSILSKTALPTKLFEYMSIGKPILVCGIGEPKNFVEKAKAGLVCSARNAGKLAELFKEFINSKEKWAEWGENGQKFIQKYYSSDKIILIVNRMFNEMKQKY